ncbi:hypothetical protein BH10PSE13_BH10PSE13_22880 [soil metagenome]
MNRGWQLRRWRQVSLPAQPFPPPEDSRAIEVKAHDAYVAAINSNDIDTFMEMVTDDIVYQAPVEPEIVGKDAVRKWGASYFGAYHTHWAKTLIGLRSMVIGHSSDTPMVRPTRTGGRAPSAPIGAKASTSIGGARTANGAWRSTAGVRISGRVRESRLKPFIFRFRRDSP